VLRVPLATVLREWGRIGCIGFGGPPAHIRLLRQLCVERRGWLDARAFEDAIAVCNLMPGPASTQLAIFCAWRVRGRAGALIDTTMLAEQATELRIHGVSGSDGPTMLEHPQALQVAGNAVAGFYRRWSPDGAGKPSVPWKLEAYSWGGLTEAPLASASWLLLAPFMMYNVAYFMLPATVAASEPAVITEPVPHLRRDRGHAIAHVLLRLLAMAATIQFMTAAVTVTMSTVAWQAAGKTNSLLPSWMGWYGRWTAGWRVALAIASVAAGTSGGMTSLTTSTPPGLSSR